MILERLRMQLPPASAEELGSVLADVAGDASRIVGDDLVGVYLSGSFADVAGDASSDVETPRFVEWAHHEVRRRAAAHR